MIVAKARRKGFSYKAAAIHAHEYTFIKNSVGLIVAFEGTYAKSTFDMVGLVDNWLMENTPFGKHKLVDKQDEMVSGYIVTENGKSIEKGFKSKVAIISVKNDATKVIGKSANIMSFEEAGKFPNLIETFGKAEATFREGDASVGTPLIWGTGGDMESGTVDFCEMFYNPTAYGLRAFENIWDTEGSAGDTCGYFVPCTQFLGTHIDKDGNSDLEGAKEYINERRNVLKEAGDSTAYLEYVSQWPFTPQEAFLQASGSFFPVALLEERRAYLETNAEGKNLGQRGRFETIDRNSVRWIPDDSLFEAPYPFKSGDKAPGCVVIYEHPYSEKPYNGVYIAGCDPYTSDYSEYGYSLGATYIFKRMHPASGSSSFQIVAEYVGRPDRSAEYYDTMIQLLTYYNAQVLYENMFKDVKNYFQNRKKLHLLKLQPDNILNRIVPNSKVKREYGIHMNKQIKRFAESLTRDWLLEEREGGILNLDTLPSLNLVKELISYNINDNFDRVIAFMLVILFAEDIHFMKVDEKLQNTSNQDWTKFHQTFSGRVINKQEIDPRYLPKTESDE
jgi:hypothetical protein